MKRIRRSSSWRADAVQADALLVAPRRPARTTRPSERSGGTVRELELDAHVEPERQPPLVDDLDAAAADVDRHGLAADLLLDPAHGHGEAGRDADELAPLDPLDARR